MIVYQATKEKFLSDSFTGDIEEIILAAYRKATGRGIGDSEVLSWRHSLMSMAKVLNDDGIPSDAGVGIEFISMSTDVQRRAPGIVSETWILHPALDGGCRIRSARRPIAGVRLQLPSPPRKSTNRG